jgi:actin-like ATPase involved in cell morphogenesis
VNEYSAERHDPPRHESSDGHQMTSDPWVLAIDFGTSFTVAASRIADRPPEVIEIDGERRLPSVIMIDDGGEVMVGKSADDLASTNPGRVLRSPKSRLGEPAPVVLGGRPYSIVSLVAHLLRHVHAEAVRYHGSEPDQVRLTHPATWSGPLRRQLLAAAGQAGISDAVLVPEPVAAAIAYADEGAVPDGGHVLVYDLGGGTFDTAALQSSSTGFVVVGRPGGDPRLGGELFDELLANTIGERLDPEVYEHIQLADDALWQQAAVGLMREARRVKEALSSHPFAEALLGLPNGLVQQRVSQGDLYDVIAPYITESVDVMRQTALGAGLESSDLSSIYLVGGASRTPLVEELVSAAFPDVPVSRRGDPKGVVALGATHPRATPTSLAQRSSLDRASTLEQPGPPPPAAPVAAPVVAPPLAIPPVAIPPVANPPAATIRGDTVIDEPPSTRIDSVLPTPGTVVDSVVGPPPLVPFVPVAPFAPSAAGGDGRAGPKHPRAWVAAFAAAIAMFIGSVVVLAGGGDDDDVSATETSQPTADTSVGVVSLEPSLPTDTRTPSTDDTVPPDTDVEVAPPEVTTTVPPSTAPPAALTPTVDQLNSALIQLDDLTAGEWTTFELQPSPPVCGATAQAGVIGEATQAYSSTQQVGLVIAHSVTAYGDPAQAATDFDAMSALLQACPTKADVNGVSYDITTQVEAIADETLANVPCVDDAAAAVIGYSNPAATLPLAFESYTAVRCGSNITLIGILTTDDNIPADYNTVAVLALLRLNNLPGSN